MCPRSPNSLLGSTVQIVVVVLRHVFGQANGCAGELQESLG